jgi:hypothetical protein
VAGTVLRVPRESRALVDIFSAARAGPSGSVRFSAAQVEQISRTVRRAPEVMVKVTGGATRVGSVSAHVSYISRKGQLEIETDDGDRIGRDGQRELLKSWHLELSPGQYRQAKDGASRPRELKLVHNIVLSMPRPTPPDKVLRAARTFARENFGLQHRYAMALHTDQEHPHVHLVVKAEGQDGRRLHIDKAMLRDWREQFAQLMRDQGIAANATPRAVRGRTTVFTRDRVYRTPPSRSRALRERVKGVAIELHRTGTIRDPARPRLVATRKLIVDGWMGVAAQLEVQGEILLAGDVRYFASNLPKVLTDRERLAMQLLRHQASQRAKNEPPAQQRVREWERTR